MIRDYKARSGELAGIVEELSRTHYHMYLMKKRLQLKPWANNQAAKEVQQELAKYKALYEKSEAENTRQAVTNAELTRRLAKLTAGNCSPPEPLDPLPIPYEGPAGKLALAESKDSFYWFNELKEHQKAAKRDLDQANSKIKTLTEELAKRR